MLGGDLIGGIALKIAGRKNPCDYAVIAMSLAGMMKEEEDPRTRRGRGDHSYEVCVISDYAVITDGDAE